MNRILFMIKLYFAVKAECKAEARRKFAARMRELEEAYMLEG